MQQSVDVTSRMLRNFPPHRHHHILTSNVCQARSPSVLSPHFAYLVATVCDWGRTARFIRIYVNRLSVIGTVFYTLDEWREVLVLESGG